MKLSGMHLLMNRSEGRTEGLFILNLPGFVCCDLLNSVVYDARPSLGMELYWIPKLDRNRLIFFHFGDIIMGSPWNLRNNGAPFGCQASTPFWGFQ
jgi:hypothetical protein